MHDTYFDRRKYKSLKVIERDLDEICFTVFLEDRDISSICVIKKHVYFGIKKTSLLVKIYVHYSFL